MGKMLLQRLAQPLETDIRTLQIIVSRDMKPVFSMK